MTTDTPLRPDGTPDDAIQYIGHHFSADAPWMEHWLGLQTYRRCSLDTESAQQCVDESSELDLERGIAMKYTNMGFYSQELIEWKRANKKLCEDGYGYIPSDILIPYSARDVIAPYRAYPLILRQLEGQGLTKYYNEILNPFFTDVFTGFALQGLPMDRQRMDELRELFHFARRRLEQSLKERIHSEARASVMGRLMDALGDSDGLSASMRVLNAPDEATAIEIIKELVPVEDVPGWIKRIQHLHGSKDFNIRSPDMLRRWLFDVEGLTPVKSTNQKAKGFPSMAWDKVLELPPERQRQYTPAVDKQSLQILSTQLSTLNQLLDLNAVGNICKAFLKEAEIVKKVKAGQVVGKSVGADEILSVANDRLEDGDLSYEYAGLEDEEEDGTELKENGLHAWLSSENRVICLYSLTETGRPRAWRPNVLNWPSYVNERIGRAVMQALREANEDGSLPECLYKWLEVGEKNLPSIRSCVTAPEGWVMIESDYCAAEMFGLAVISGDAKFMRILSEPDPEWACLVDHHPLGKYVRVMFSDESETGIPKEEQDPKYIMSVWKDRKCLGSVTEDDLARNADGSVKHRGYDIHWQVVERTYGKPREAMLEKVHRNAGKVLNFCIAEDSLVLTRDRGPVAIQNIRLDDWLWDGVEWVRHEGVICTGEKPIIEYQGLRATRLHDVWTVEQGKVKLEEACAKSLSLVRAGGSCAQAGRAGSYYLSGHGGEARRGLLLRKDALRSVFGGALEGTPELRTSQVVEVSVPAPTCVQGALSWSRSSGYSFAGAALQIDDPALLHGHARIVLPVLQAWDFCGVLGLGGFRQLGVGVLYGQADSGERLRPHRQRRELLEGQSEARGPFHESTESRLRAASELPRGEAISGGAPSDTLHLEDRAGVVEAGDECRRDYDKACEQFCSGTAQTYDIINAGPRRRYTCCGVLVSNSSAYGASPASLERKIESDTGVKPEEGTGQRGLDAIDARQPRASQFLAEQAMIPKTVGYARAASGRIRHCVLHGSGADVSWRVRQAQESALGREMRNFPYLLGESKLGELMESHTDRDTGGNHEPSRRSDPAEGATTRHRCLPGKAEACNVSTSAQMPHRGI